MVRGPRFLCLLLLGCLLHAGAAYGAPGDPEAGSPSGSVYELPLDSARGDAAPGSGGTTAPEPASPDSGSGGAGEGEGAGSSEEEGPDSSYYRSENNFGSSSQVPGTAEATAGSESGGGAGTDASGNSGAQGPGNENTSAPVHDTGNTSIGGNLALLAAIGLVAALLGAFAMRRRVRTR